MNGKILQTFREKARKGSNIVYMKGRASLKPGVYVISVKIQGEVEQEKFVVME